MQEIVCYTTYLPEGTEQYITFMELLLDDNWANGTISCPDEVYCEIGNINTKLASKQNYEFLLRAVQKYPLKAIGTSSTEPINSSETPSWEDFCTDCYITGKYQKELLDSGYFNPVVESLLHCATLLPNPKAATDFLEKMISHSPEYYEIDDNTRPILIYRGDSTCYDQLNTFADELAKALISCRQSVEVFDVKKEGNQALTKYIGQHFKAIIGIQTYVFSIMMQDKTTNLHDLIIGPKFNMIFDHPVLLKEHITTGPKDYYLLVHDRNYLHFIQQYYPNVKGCFHFAPAGIELNAPLAISPSRNHVPAAEKLYDISFIGSYYNYRQILANINSFERKSRFLANHFLNEMKRNPNQPTETALKKVLEHNRINLSNDRFLDLLFQFRYIFFCVMYYYREKVIRTLLDAGIELNVYGDSWNSAPFANHPCLNRHPQVNAYESLLVMQQSRISLNIMAWHKDGFTERIANAMLNHSVVVSDKSTQLEELFVDNQDLVLFDLENTTALSGIIQTLLNSSELLDSIAEHGYLKVAQSHQWLHRSGQFLEILGSIK